MKKSSNRKLQYTCFIKITNPQWPVIVVTLMTVALQISESFFALSCHRHCSRGDYFHDMCFTYANHEAAEQHPMTLFTSLL